MLRASTDAESLAGYFLIRWMFLLGVVCRGPGDAQGLKRSPLSRLTRSLLPKIPLRLLECQLPFVRNAGGNSRQFFPSWGGGVSGGMRPNPPLFYRGKLCPIFGFDRGKLCPIFKFWFKAFDGPTGCLELHPPMSALPFMGGVGILFIHKFFEVSCTYVRGAGYERRRFPYSH